ncbi:uncharacterized protein QC763_0033220 [Podospora pseudopauciseta]|uniref:Uncharacterized protein n=1 Tax=Podospora pseudopauciseta TaxID=2093780 RepID=A0ABR0HNR6_9PEZI|nr:hypothetical protein QC763_0033220 [Podospora pseudopauciseta]
MAPWLPDGGHVHGSSRHTQYQHVLWMRVIARDATTTTTTTIITITTSPDPRPHVPRPTAHGEE